MYLLTYDYEDTNRDDVFTEQEAAEANKKYFDLLDDPYASNVVALVMCVGISFNNRPDAKVYTYRTEEHIGINKVIEPFDANGNRWVNEYGEPISVYVKSSGYRPAEDVKRLAHNLGREKLDVLYLNAG